MHFLMFQIIPPWPMQAPPVSPGPFTLVILEAFFFQDRDTPGSPCPFYAPNPDMAVHPGS